MDARRREGRRAGRWPWMGLMLVTAGCAGAEAGGPPPATPAPAAPAPSPKPAPSEVASPYFELSGLDENAIVHLPTGVRLEEAALLDWLSAFGVVYVGETHDSVHDHRVQLAILSGLTSRRAGPLALGLEMLPVTAQPVADAWVRGELDEKAFARLWSEHWGPDSWPYYRDLLRHARDHGVELVALNASRAQVAAVGRQGLEEARKTDSSLPEVVLEDPYHRRAVEAIFAGHGHGHGGGAGMSRRFYDVQVLWEETMAASVARWAEAHPDGRLVVLAGGFHVRYGYGIPRRAFARTPRSFATVLPWTVEVAAHKERDLMDVELPDPPLPPADVVWGVVYDDLARVQARLGAVIEPVAEGEGARVREVVPGGPAAAAGLEAGDVIVAIDREAVTDPFDVRWAAWQRQPGDQSTVEVVQTGGEPRRVQLTWRAVPPPTAP